MTLELTIPALTVFLQGLLSFFSPCVLPIVPLYLGYLSGGTASLTEEGTVTYAKGKVLRNTLFFVAGICFAFFLLGFGFTALGQFFQDKQTLFARIGGVLVILFGCFQLGWLGGTPLDGEHRFHMNLQNVAVNPAVAWLMGFTFSFAWTPCVGPALTTVLVMASSAQSAGLGFVLIGVYTLGFVLPFLAVGLFTTKVLALFQKYRRALAYTVKISGVLMLLMGVMLFTGWMNGVTSYLSSLGTPSAPTTSQTQPAPESTPEPTPEPAPEPAPEPTPEPEAESATDYPTAFVFELQDQYGNIHNLADYRGKTVLLNFWATWCPHCVRAMPDLQALYEEYGENQGDVIILGMALPKNMQNTRTSEGDLAQVTQYLSDNGYEYPSLMDLTGGITTAYRVSAYPTTFLIDGNGDLFGYVPGAMTADMMRSAITQTQAVEIRE